MNKRMEPWLQSCLPLRKGTIKVVHLHLNAKIGKFIFARKAKIRPEWRFNISTAWLRPA